MNSGLLFSFLTFFLLFWNVKDICKSMVVWCNKCFDALVCVCDSCNSFYCWAYVVSDDVSFDVLLDLWFWNSMKKTYFEI